MGGRRGRGDHSVGAARQIIVAPRWWPERDVDAGSLLFDRGLMPIGSWSPINKDPSDKNTLSIGIDLAAVVNLRSLL